LPVRKHARPATIAASGVRSSCDSVPGIRPWHGWLPRLGARLPLAFDDARYSSSARFWLSMSAAVTIRR